MRMGLPKVITSDQGTKFNNKLDNEGVQEITEKLELNNRLWHKLLVKLRLMLGALFYFDHSINNRHSKLMCYKWRWSVRRT